MFCPNCGAEIAEGANFCPQCGQQVVQAPTPADSTGQAQPTATAPERSAAQPPRTEAEPAPAISRLDEGGWARIVFSLGLLGLLFIAFTNFGGPVQAFLSSLATRVYGYGAAKPVLGILFGGGMVALGFIFKEQLKGLLNDLEVMLVGGGIALAGILMLITGGMGGLGWFIFQVLIGAVLGGVGFVLLKISTIFTDNKLEAISSKVVPFALLVFAAFTIVSGVGTLLSLGFLAYDLPQVFLIISSITGLLGVLGFAGATVLRLLGIEPGR
ncbi:MAG TPA: zinc-ribbon domain-containing protein [bacterium]|nr:zinc-ribbon domain-containing protein [bacterium]